MPKTFHALPVLIFFVSALALFISVSYAFIAGNLIVNGDFSSFNNTAMNGGNASLTDAYAKWTNTPFYNVTSSCNSAGVPPNPIRCVIFNTTNGFCPTYNFTQNCVEYISGSLGGSIWIGANTPTFAWTSNSTYGTVNFYAYDSQDINQPYLIFQLVNIDHSIIYSSQRIAIDLNESSPSTTRLYTINITNFTYGGNYQIEVLSFSPQTLYFGNMSLFPTGATTFLQTLTGKCDVNFDNNQLAFNNVTPYSCQTSPINTSKCSSLQSIGGLISLSTYDGNSCGINQTWYGYNFNLTNKFTQNNQLCGLYEYQNLHDLTTYGSPNTVPYVNQSGVFSTCYYYWNTTNVTLRNLHCELSIGCNYNITQNGCASYCDSSSNILYTNGTLDNVTNTCSFTQSSLCTSGCSADLTSCAILNVYNTSNGNSYNNYTPNTSSTILNVFFAMLFSPSGSLWILDMIISYVFTLVMGEELSLYMFGTITIMFGLMGGLPTGLSFVIAIISYSMGIFDHEKSVLEHTQSKITSIKKTISDKRHKKEPSVEKSIKDGRK